MEHNSIRNAAEIKRAGESIFGRKHGVEAYDLLNRGYDPDEIVEELDMTNQSLQRYVQDWRDEDLVKLRGNRYEVTEKGKFFYKIIEYGDLGINLGMERVNELLEERVE